MLLSTIFTSYLNRKREDDGRRRDDGPDVITLPEVSKILAGTGMNVDVDTVVRLLPTVAPISITHLQDAVSQALAIAEARRRRQAERLCAEIGVDCDDEVTYDGLEQLMAVLFPTASREEHVELANEMIPSGAKHNPTYLDILSATSGE